MTINNATTFTTMSMTTTHYQVLSVSENASHSEIKAAHRRKALEYHPDRFHHHHHQQQQHERSEEDVGRKKEEAERIRVQSFRDIQKAWECLRDEDKRKEYDDSLKRIRERLNGTMNKAHVVKLSDMECELCDVEDENYDDDDPVVGSGSGSAKESDTQKLYSYKCRCGDVIEILEEELSLDGESLWECPSCSLAIHIIQN